MDAMPNHPVEVFDYTSGRTYQGADVDAWAARCLLKLCPWSSGGHATKADALYAGSKHGKVEE